MKVQKLKGLSIASITEALESDIDPLDTEGEFVSLAAAIDAVKALVEVDLFQCGECETVYEDRDEAKDCCK